ncbi:hypothetical protein [Sphingobium lignivorans]|uniref:Uncharacterized protein n=1 Tax=Sphingobium lignivorans TaxID=2735886 RepID=A0ABR6NCV7_9SPHN|nr:hypothetical protein [Sphingobium lignivorans]MBB5985108.1 hypothetical protein [Sphingobium lignivorans]
MKMGPQGIGAPVAPAAASPAGDELAEDWPDGAGFFRGFILALPPAGLLWWGIMKLIAP